MSKTLKDEIIAHVERLDAPLQRKVLDFARRLAEPRGTPGPTLSRFQGSIESADLEAMSHAIQQGCEQIDPDAW